MAEGRFRYAQRTQRNRQQRESLRREFPTSTTLDFSETATYLRSQGFHIDEQSVVRLSYRLFGPRQFGLNFDQIIAVIGRLSVQEQVERDLRRLFDFFSGGEQIIGCSDLKAGLLRLGENVKEREVNQMFLEMDLNSNGFVDFETFLEAMLD